MSEVKTRTKWGRAKFGNRQIPAMRIAIPCGLVLGIILSLVAVWNGIAGPNKLLGGTVFAVCLTIPATMLVWALVVDRSSLQGAVDLPEQSIESQWYQQAAAGTQLDVILAAILGILALSIFPSGNNADPKLILGGVIAISIASVAIRYQLLRRKP